MHVIDQILEHAAETAGVFDVDGTLAGIVDRAEDATVEPEMRGLLRRGSEVFLAEALLTGRDVSEARRVVGVAELDTSGLHGAQWLPAGADPASAALDARLVPWLPRVQGLLRVLASERGAELLAAADVRLEVKMDVMLALHYRGVADRDRAHRLCEVVQLFADADGFRTRLALETLEILPDVPLTKREGVKELVRRSGAVYAFYAGDGPTDLDAFQGLDDLKSEGVLRGAWKIAVDNGEISPELRASADLVVNGVEGMAALLRQIVD